MLWVTSDFHFDHFNIIKYTNRPFESLYQMNETIIKKFNSVVSNDDTTYFLGDFCFCKRKSSEEDYIKVARSFRERLNGKVILIRGNHDRDNRVMRLCGFDEAYDKLIIDNDTTKLLLSHRRISNMPTINVSIELWNYYPIPLPTVLKQPIHLCGHSHELWSVSTGTVSSDPKERNGKVNAITVQWKT